MKKLIILALLFSGIAKAQSFDFYCLTDQDIQIQSYYELGGSDNWNELKNMMIKFKADGAANDHPVVFELGIVLDQHGNKWPGFWDTPFDGTIGHGGTLPCNKRTKWVRFSSWWWNNSTIASQIIAVYHELGHSYFKYSHSSTGGIMRATLNETAADYITNGKLNSNFLGAVADMFNEVGQNSFYCAGSGKNNASVIECSFTKQ